MTSLLDDDLDRQLRALFAAQAAAVDASSALDADVRVAGRCSSARSRSPRQSVRCSR